MSATFSTENQIENALRELRCSGRNFAAIVSERGIRFSHTSFVRGMKDGFDTELGQRLLELLKQMKTARDAYRDIPIDWSQHSRVALLLTLILMKEVAAEDGHEQLRHDLEEVIRQEQ